MEERINKIPTEENFDSTLALLEEGYLYISNRCEKYQSAIFKTRLLFKDTICMQGAEAAEIFYDKNLFSRKGATPKFIQSTLFGKGGVQGLDNHAHYNRKLMFMDLMEPKSIRKLCKLVNEEWCWHVKQWDSGNIVLFDEIRKVLCSAVCKWTGVPLAKSELEQRADDFEVMIEGAGTLGLQHWRGRLARKKIEKWIQNLIEQVRNQTINIDDDNKALQNVAFHRDVDGELLDSNIAAVELINVLRPTIAVARYIAFVALALHTYPECKRKLTQSNGIYYNYFAHEIRRFYPFFPFVVARARKGFSWNGYHFKKGQRVLLDLYGTNQDETFWKDPETFNPDRFQAWDVNAYNFIPQGGGNHYHNHRCPGEWITVELIKTATAFLIENLKYNVPHQNLNIDMSKIPTIPQSGFIINNVKLNAQPRAKFCD